MSWLLRGVFGPSRYFISNPSSIIPKRCCWPHPNWKWSNRWRCCKFHYWLICYCRRRPKNLPTSLSVSFFPYNCCAKHWRWRRERARAKALFKNCWVDEFLIVCKNGYFPWEYESVSKTARDSFCDDENRYFLKLQILLPLFTNINHVVNVANLTQREILLCGQILENRVLQNIYCRYLRTTMLVWDTGDSYGLTPFRSYFIDYVKCGIPVKDVIKVNRVIGIVTTLHNFVESNGQDIILSCVSYHLAQTDVLIFFPQNYQQTHGGHSAVQGYQVTMHLPFHRIHISVDLGGTNLLVVHNSFVTEHQKRAIGPQMRSSLDYSILSELDIVGDIKTCWYIQAMYISREKMEIENEFDHNYSNFCGTCAGAPANQFFPALKKSY